MPPVSEKQRRAMYAAAEGHSTLGVPKSVGKEYIAADNDGPIAAGIMYVSEDGEILLLRRSSTEENWAGHWGFPGGGAEPSETPIEAASREAIEEMGDVSPIGDLRLFQTNGTPNGFTYYTFIKSCAKFVPVLNDEHSGYAWATMGQLPGPLHPAIASMLEERFQLSTITDWAGFNRGFAMWANEKPEQAQDSIAMDRNSVRRIDEDGHMHVAMTPISKANVCPYYGREIPGYQSLGLDPERIYKLYRDAGELAKAATSFAGKPVLITHVPISADDHPHEKVIGSIGDDVTFDDPYLKAPLTIWDGDAIELINSGKQKELSSAYRYTPDMTPGVANGEQYDGVMRNISANHLALVESGRAGSDVLVQDAAITIDTNKEARMANKLATAKKSKLAEALKGVLAQDANIDEVVARIIALDAEKDKAYEEKAMDKEDDDEDDKAMDDADKATKVMGEDDDDDAEDEDDDDKKDRKAMDAKPKARKSKSREEMVSKSAMDAAIAKASKIAEDRAIQRLRDIAVAHEDVAPHVGKLAGAFDSAEDVYRAALTGMGMDVSTIKETAALRMLVTSKAIPSVASVASAKVAMDAKGVSAFYERFPEAAR